MRAGRARQPLPPVPRPLRVRIDPREQDDRAPLGHGHERGGGIRADDGGGAGLARVLSGSTGEIAWGSREALTFRQVSKEYEALVCGEMEGRGEIDLALQRDHRFPPFMRVATPESELEAQTVVAELRHAGYKKLIMKKAKESTTAFEVIGRERFGSHPVTRLKLVPHTGRTHQLRVHCAALGHPIVGDRPYGMLGEASPNGGFEDAVMDQMSPGRASAALQEGIRSVVMEKETCMCLHAKELAMPHPATGEWVVYRADVPF